MKKILFVIPALVGGGAERVMVTLANNLSQNHDVEILTLTSTDCFYELNNKVTVEGLGCCVNKRNFITRTFTRVKVAFKAFFGLKKAIKDKKTDVVIGFLNSVSQQLLLLKMFSKMKCKLIVSERADPNERSFFCRWFERNFYPRADVVVCQGTKAAEFFKEKHRKKIVIIPNPICADAIPPIFEGQRKKTIVGVGRLAEQKNFAMLISAFSKLDEKFSDYKLEIYGAGPLENQLNDQIKALGLTEKAFLMGAKKNVMFEIADASLYVMSSNFEGFPNALVEAMATGLPVISTDFPTGVASEIVKEENGIVVSIKDEQALLNAMEEILSDEERMKKMSLENRKFLEILKEESVIAMWENIF